MEYKKIGPFFRTGYHLRGNCQLKLCLERCANLESRAAHTHPKNTQVPPPPPPGQLITQPFAALHVTLYLLPFVVVPTLLPCMGILEVTQTKTWEDDVGSWSGKVELRKDRK